MTGSLRGRGEELRGQVHDRAEQRLEELIEQRRQERGLSPEVDAALAARRHEREQRAAQQQIRAQALQHAVTPEERRVLTRVADACPLSGGQPPAPRYTALLDALAPGGDAGREMAIHRAIWGLAERRVLAVSAHGEVDFGPLVTGWPVEGQGSQGQTEHRRKARENVPLMGADAHGAGALVPGRYAVTYGSVRFRKP